MVWSSNLPCAVIIPCACVALLYETSSSSHVCNPLCVSTQSWVPEASFGVRNRLQIENFFSFNMCQRLWPSLIVRTLIFLATGPIPDRGDGSYLVAHTARAQTNTSIQTYQRKTDQIVHIVFLGLGLQSSLTQKYLLCLYSITLWSKFFEPRKLATLRVSADPWALIRPFGLV